MFFSSVKHSHKLGLKRATLVLCQFSLSWFLFLGIDGDVEQRLLLPLCHIPGMCSLELISKHPVPWLLKCSRSFHFYSNISNKYIRSRLLPSVLLPSAMLNRNHPVSKIKDDIFTI